MGQIWEIPKGNFRKNFYTSASVQHPAKMHPLLCAKIFDYGREKGYWKPGDLIIDPMAGIFTTGIEGILRGYNVIGIELEEKFCKLAQGCIGLVKQKASRLNLGKAWIVCGDARDLSNLLGGGNGALCSPPYSVDPSQSHMVSKNRADPSNLNYRPSWKRKIEKENYLETTRSFERKENISNLPYSGAISSPPYAGTQSGGGIAKRGYQGSKHSPTDLVGKRSYMPENIGGNDNISNLPYGAAISSPPYGEGLGHSHGTKVKSKLSIMAKEKGMNIGEYSKGKKNIGDLPHGRLNGAVCSPPYSEGHKAMGGKDPHPEKAGGSARISEGYSDNPENIGNLPHGAICSPPYEGSLEGTSRHTKGGIPSRDKKLGQTGTYAELDPTVKRLREHGRSDKKAGGPYGKGLAHPYSRRQDNIGNLKEQTYVGEMLKVYQELYQVLRPKAVCCLVTKNFIRQKKLIRLDLDTIKLMDMAGFELIERVKAKLPHKSFWRVLYEQKYPEVPKIEHEDVLFFERR